VHALAAPHLMLTVRRLHREGLRHFAVIHDSYGVHGFDVPRLRRALREEFVRMYRAPILEQFIEAQITTVCENDAATGEGGAQKDSRGKKATRTLQELHADLPPPGELAIEEVLTANYMFA